MLRLQIQLYIYPFMSVSPQKGASYEMGKTYIHRHGAPRRGKDTYVYNGMRPGSPRGWLTTLLSVNQCHATFSTIPSTLACVNKSPVGQRGPSNPPKGVAYTRVTASHVTLRRVEYEST